MRTLTEHERFLILLDKIDACEDAIDWVKRNKFEIQDAWNECNRFSWFVYLVSMTTVYYKSHTLKSILDYIKQIYEEIFTKYSEDLALQLLDKKLNKIIKNEEICELNLSELSTMANYTIPRNFIYGVDRFTTLYLYCRKIGEERSNSNPLKDGSDLLGEIVDTMYDLIMRFNMILDNKFKYSEIDNNQQLIDEFKKIFPCPTVPDLTEREVKEVKDNEY